MVVEGTRNAENLTESQVWLPRLLFKFLFLLMLTRLHRRCSHDATSLREQNDNRNAHAKVSERFYSSRHKVSDRSRRFIVRPRNQTRSVAICLLSKHKDLPRQIGSPRGFLGLREVLKWSYLHRRLVSDCAAIGFV